jgi:hypothetical protein
MLILDAPGLDASTLLARWAADVSERRLACVAFVPIGRAYRSTLEREVLPLFSGLLDEPTAAPRAAGSVRAPRREIRDALRFDREPDEPVRLVVLDGIDELSGWSVGGELPLFHDLGARVKVVITSHRGDATPELEQLGWDSDEVTCVVWRALNQRSDEQIRAVAHALRREGGAPETALQCVCLLASALGPMDTDALESALEVTPGAARDALAAAWISVCGLLDRDTEATGYRFRDEGLRRTWESVVSPPSLNVDSALVGAGRRWLACAMAGTVPPRSIPRYFVEYHGAHLRRAHGGMTELLALVTPTWLDAWTAREDWVFGFLEDVSSARARAESDLSDHADDAAQDDADSAAEIAGIVRCALVTASLLSLEALNRPDTIAGSKFQAPELDFTRVPGGGGARAQALLALGRETSPPRRVQLFAWAREAISRDPAPSGDALLDVARETMDASGSAMAHRAVDAFRHRDDELHDGQALLGLLRVAPLLDGPSGQALIKESVRRTRELDRVSAAPWELVRAATELTPSLAWELHEAAASMSAPNRELLRAWIVPQLPLERRAGALDEVSTLLDSRIPRKPVHFPEEFHGHHDVDGALRAAIGCMSELTVRGVLARALGVARADSTLIGSLAVRLAAVGNAAEALATVRGLAVDAPELAEMSLPLVRYLSPDERNTLIPLIDGYLRALDSDRRGRAIVDHAEALVLLLGPEAALALVPAADDYFGVISATALGPYLPVEARAAAVSAAVNAYRDGRDGDTLHGLVQCSEWMSRGDAIWLFCSEFGEGIAERDLSSAFLGGCGVRSLAPLIARIGGEVAVVEVASQIMCVEKWLP